MSVRGVLAVTRFEASKLRSQGKVGAVLGACLLGPFAFVVAIVGQSSLPTDTLFGRHMKASGFATPLVVLGFAAQWVFPALASVVGGDLFASEDRLGTWPTVLTRSRSRAEIFAGKAIAALLFSSLTVAVLAASSVAAGALVVGRQPLLGLSGTLLPAKTALELVAVAWVTVVPPVLAFTAIAVLVSVATRSSAAGVGVPVVLGLAMELYALVDGPEVVRWLLPTTAFGAWHGLFVEHAYTSPIARGVEASAGYVVVCLVVSYLLLRRRDIGG